MVADYTYGPVMVLAKGARVPAAGATGTFTALGSDTPEPTYDTNGAPAPIRADAFGQVVTGDGTGFKADIPQGFLRFGGMPPIAVRALEVPITAEEAKRVADEAVASAKTTIEAEVAGAALEVNDLGMAAALADPTSKVTQRVRNATGARPRLHVQTLMASPDDPLGTSGATVSPDLEHFKVGDRGIKLTIAQAGTAWVRLSPMQPVSPMPHRPASAIGLWIYLPNASLITQVSILLGSPNAGGTTDSWAAAKTSGFRDGWNLIRFPAHQSNRGKWDAFTLARVLVDTTAATTVTVGHLWAECPEKAQLLFINDGGWRNFNQVIGNALRERGFPVTWALACTTVEAMGTSTTGTHLTVAELQALQDQGDSVSFHNYDGLNQITSTATAQQIRLWTTQAQRWLQARGFNGWWYRSAFLQNNAPQAAAAHSLLAAAATGTGEAAWNTWPLTNRYSYARITLHGRSPAQVDADFDLLKQTRELYVCYTHDLNEKGGADIKRAEWDYFLGKLDTAISEGWIEGVTFEDLFARAGARYRDDLGGPAFEYKDEFGETVVLRG